VSVETVSAALPTQNRDDIKRANHEAAQTGVAELTAGAIEIKLHSGLRAVSPEGFTAPGSSRSSSAYDLAPLILCAEET
jgi:hypothetical protein